MTVDETYMKSLHAKIGEEFRIAVLFSFVTEIGMEFPVLLAPSNFV